jgi:transmembrane sensor
MENSNYFDELIVSYLSNELNPSEEAFVLEWINSSAEHKQYFEELKTTWDLLTVSQTAKHINIESEWHQFRQAIAAKQQELYIIQGGFAGNEVIEEAGPNRKGKAYRLMVRTAVAASILLAVALAWQWAPGDITARKQVAVSDRKEIISQPPAVQTQYNTTNKSRTLLLHDGSEVMLFAGSAISYYDPFISDRRDITLVGKASFKVAKDKSRPFTVYSGNISTTALGTKFTVTAFKDEKNIVVRLYEGKVVVKSSDNAKIKLKKEFYLVPGQELVYDNNNLTATVRRFKMNDRRLSKERRKETLSTDNPSVPELGKGTWYMFNNQPLSQVFDQLEEMFKVDIVYSKKDVSKKYFIGTFNVSDSLNDILNQIARLNNLKVSKKDNKIIISK